MATITKEQYEFALARIEELLKVVDDSTPSDTPNYVELDMVSGIVEEYEKVHYPISKPTNKKDYYTGEKQYNEY